MEGSKVTGFHGKLLRIDLNSQSFREEIIPLKILQRYLGGKGLGSYLLLNNVPAGIDPLSPDNKLVFVVGPATGTRLPGASRYGLYSKSPLTGGYGESYAGGKVAPKIKATGYDAIIVEGRAKEPVFLEVSDQVIKFHSARDLWGKDTYTAEDAVLERADGKDAQAVVIGPAGENLVRLACVENNYWRSAGRGGLGAVLGSKNVKAVVFHGQTPSPVRDETMLKRFISGLLAASKDLPIVKSFRKYGTPQTVALLNTAQAFPTRYWSQGVFDGWEKISGEAFITNNNFDVRPRSCPNCILACGKLTTIKSGPRAGLKIEGPEYETIYAFGGLCCINNLEEIIYLNDLCDRLGLDTISAGNLVALSMEARETGLEPGFPAYGNTAGAARLLEEMACRKGLGAILADGIIQAAKTLNLVDIAIHVKGLEPPGYDPRVLKGMALGYVTSARGACHLRATFYKPELAGIIPPSATEGKAGLYIDYEDRLTIFNTLINCVFYRDMLQWGELPILIKALTGWNYSIEELRSMANEIITMTRLFNLREGFNRESDTLPSRLHNQPLPESGASISKDELAYMLKEYYAIRGWDKTI
ncbi:MAG: aldehyde ferredoxin oxidoreductase family protein [Bacillota bacterium]